MHGLSTSYGVQADQVMAESPIGIAIINFSGRFEVVNPSYCAIYGYSEEELLANNLTLVFPSDQGQKILRLHQNFLIDGGKLEGEWKVVRKDGTLRQVLTNSVCVLGLDNHKRRLVYVTDITEKKIAEDELKAAAAIEREMTAKNIQLSQALSKRNNDLSALTAHVQRISENEKLKLAQDLHDELGSILVGLVMEIDKLTKKNLGTEFLKNLAVIQNLITDAIGIKKNIINQLYPTILENFGLNAALEWLVEECEKHSGIKIDRFFLKMKLSWIILFPWRCIALPKNA